MVPLCGRVAFTDAAYNIGEMAEWSNAAVSKTVVRHSADRGFEPPSLRKEARDERSEVATPSLGYISIPASEADMYDAIVPQIIALKPSLARSPFLSGTITPIPPS